MKLFNIIIALLFCSAVTAQQGYKSYSFKEVSLKIKVPAYFTEVDKNQDDSLLVNGKKMLENSMGQEIDVNSTITLLSIKKGDVDYMNITRTPLKNTTAAGWRADNEDDKKILYKTFQDQLPAATLDSSSSILRIDGHVFEKYRIDLNLAPGKVLHAIYYSTFINGNDLTFCFDFMDDKSGRDLEEIVRKATFIKH